MRRFLSCLRPPRRRPTRGLPPALTFDRRGISFEEGVRAGLGLAAVILLYQFLPWPGLMEAALAALLTCLCDAGGPLRRRLQAVVAFGVVGALVTGGFAWLRDSPVLLETALAGLFVFGASFARAFGASAMQVGNLLSVVCVLSLRASGPGPAQALMTGLTFLGGSLWAGLLTLVIWRLHPYRPARLAVSACVHALAALAADLRAMAHADTKGLAEDAIEALWDRHARLHRRLVRDRLELAREAVLAVVRVRGPASGPAAQSWLRLEAADQLFGTLIALSDLLSGEADSAVRGRAERVLRLTTAVLRVLEREVMVETSRLRPGLERAIAVIPLVAAQAGAPSQLRDLAEVIAERLRATLSPNQGPDRLPIVPSPRWRDVVRANLSRDSSVLRHAVRAGLVAMPGFAAMLVWPQPYLHWYAITLIVTLQPYVALTVVRAAERIGGTVLGGLLGALIGVVCATPLSTAAVLFPLSVIALTVRGVSFGLFMTALTPVVILLSEIGEPGLSEWHIALLRALFTVAGGATALLAVILLWPAWEPQRLRAQMRAAVVAHGGYAGAVIDRMLGDRADADADAEVDSARRAAGSASNAFEASLQRVLLERRLRSDAALETMLTVDAALRRLAGRLSALHHLRADPAGDEQAWRELRAWIAEVTTRIGQGLTEIPPRPDAAPGRTGDGPLRRLARPLELAAGALAREAMAGR